MNATATLAFLLAALSTAARCAEPAPTGTTYLIEARIISLSGGLSSATGLVVTADSITATTNGVWSVGGQGEDAGTLLSRLTAQPGAEVLSAPRVTMRAGQEASVRIEREVAYLAPETNTLYRVTRSRWPGSKPRVEAVTNGFFRLAKLPEQLNPGLALTLLAVPAGEGSVQVDARIRYNLMTSPPSLPASELALTRPEIESREISTRLILPPAQWAVLGGLPPVRRESDRQEEALIVFLRVSTPSP